MFCIVPILNLELKMTYTVIEATYMHVQNDHLNTNPSILQMIFSGYNDMVSKVDWCLS